jgi:16S rRNA G1207 methylase RsmC
MVHYYSKYQESEIKLKKIKAKLRGISFEFYTGSGVFSKDKVDKGSELLINSCIIKKNWRILDLGCGYGAVGITLAKTFSDLKVVMIDVNKRAVKLARMNMKLSNIDNARVFSSNLFEKINEKFNTIIVNPPQKAGKDICFKIIEESKDYLEKKGLLQLVARHNKGGKVLSQKMEEVFGNVKDIAKKSGYRMYVSSMI